MTEWIYHIKDLAHSYGDTPVLQIDELKVPASAIIGLMGPNGCGKSTLLKIMGCLMTPTRGTILFKGKPAAPFDPAVRFSVTMVPQEPFLMKRSVIRNLMYGLRLRRCREGVGERIQDAMTQVGLPPDHYLHRPWFQLSAGEAQRVALAARLALQPEVLLLDEPTASVDAASIDRIKTASLQAREKWGTTLIVASHDGDWLHDIADEVWHIFGGRYWGSGKINALFGPWERRSPGLWGKTGDASAAGPRVPRPPHPDAVAVIPPETVVLYPSHMPVPDGKVCLEGRLTGIFLEGDTGNLRLTIQLGESRLTASLSAAQTAELQLLPGRRVTACYDPAAVCWF